MTLSRTLADSLHENFSACQLGGRGVSVRIRTGGELKLHIVQNRLELYAFQSCY